MSTISEELPSTAAEHARFGRGPSNLPRAPTTWAQFGNRWWPLGVGIAALLGSTAYRFAVGIWQQSDYDYGALLLIAAIWVFYNERSKLLESNPPRSALGAQAALGSALLLYLVGVRIQAAYVEFAAVVGVFAASLWLIGGPSLPRRMWPALAFLLIALPLPANLVVAATGGLKEWVSATVESTMHFAGFPIARDGVTLRIGPYSLLIADACSGMNSLISLSFLGLLYIYLTARRSVLQVILLLASVLPIALATNVVRVLVLALITFYLGDEAGQGFLHEFAGFIMFLTALAILVALDSVLGLFLAKRPEHRHAEP